jgi:lipoyl(octanoyl) transferase
VKQGLALPSGEAPGPDLPRRRVRTHWLGALPYGEAHALQEALVSARVRGEIGDTLLLLEHPPVITLGRSASMTDVLIDPALREELGVELFETGRGGHVTVHGPGQLVAYPIFDLKPERCDVRRYIHDLGDVMCRLARELGVEATFVREPALHIGVWVGERKLGAIGVRLSRWVTMHGFAFNVSTDLRLFDLIVPCGMPESKPTSLLREGLPERTPESFIARTMVHFADVFGAEVSRADHVETTGLFAFVRGNEDSKGVE